MAQPTIIRVAAAVPHHCTPPLPSWTHTDTFRTEVALIVGEGRKERRLETQSVKPIQKVAVYSCVRSRPTLLPQSIINKRWFLPFGGSKPSILSFTAKRHKRESDRYLASLAHNSIQLFFKLQGSPCLGPQSTQHSFNE